MRDNIPDIQTTFSSTNDTLYTAMADISSQTIESFGVLDTSSLTEPFLLHESEHNREIQNNDPFLSFTDMINAGSSSKDNLPPELEARPPASITSCNTEQIYSIPHKQPQITQADIAHRQNSLSTHYDIPKRPRIDQSLMKRQQHLDQVKHLKTALVKLSQAVDYAPMQFAAPSLVSSSEHSSNASPLSTHVSPTPPSMVDLTDDESSTVNMSRKRNSGKRKRSANVADLCFIGIYRPEEPPYDRIRVWQNDRQMYFYDCECGMRKPGLGIIGFLLFSPGFK